MCGSLAGWFQVAIQAVDWFVPEHHLCIGLRCRFCEVQGPEGLGKLMMLSAKEEGKTFEKLGIHVKSKKHN